MCKVRQWAHAAGRRRTAPEQFPQSREKAWVYGLACILLLLTIMAVSARTPQRDMEKTTERRVVIPAFAGEIRGRVLFEGRDIREPPVPGRHVRVRLLADDEGQVVAEAVADKEGNFHFTIPEAGRYTLKVGRLSIKVEVILPEKESPVASKQMVFIIPRQMAQ